MSSLKRFSSACLCNLPYGAGLVCLLAVFFFPVLSGAKGFFAGDHMDQHFPWWVWLTREIQSGNFPAWTSLITCGFPLLAEGQTGCFYPLNLFFARFFSPETGYHANILFHFLAGGWFFFLYARFLGLSRKSAFFAALLYVFGTARAGYFYNITSQRVLIWFPLALLLTEHLLRKARFTVFLLLALTFYLQWTAGYQQYAVYSMSFTGLYAFLRIFFRPEDEGRKYPVLPRPKFIILFAAAVLLGTLLALPQLLPFSQLLARSSRISAPEEIAFVGSVNPLGLIALFYPDWDSFFNSELYIGALPLFFILLVLFSKKTYYEKLWIGLALFSYFLALGGYNPLFVLWVKITHYTGRAPLKFLYFASTFLALWAGFGMERFLQKMPLTDKALRKARNGFMVLCLSVLALAGFAMLVLRAARHFFLKLGEILLDLFILGSPLHPHTEEFYRDKLLRWYEALLGRIGPDNFYTLLFSLLTIGACLFAFFLLRRTTRKRLMFVLILSFTAVELFAYSQHGVLGNLRPRSVIHSESKIISRLIQDTSFYRAYTITENGDYKGFPTYPNFNMSLGIPQIGGYSPLIPESYNRYLAPFGGINNSLLTSRASLPAVEQHRARLNFLGVKYVLSKTALNPRFFKFLLMENNIYLYENSAALGGAYWIPASAVSTRAGHLTFDESQITAQNEIPILSKTFGNSEYEVTLNARDEGFLVLAVMNYPGWTAQVDHRPGMILTVNDFALAVPVPQGQHYVRFYFSFTESLKQAAVKS